MKKRNRLSLFVLAIALLVGFMPFEASANSPPPAPFYSFQIHNLPENSAYVDILIPFSESDDYYETVNQDLLPDEFSADAEIIYYCKQGFYSYTFHYRDAASVISLDREGFVYFFADEAFVSDWDGEVRYAHCDDIYERGYIRLAILDKFGNILHVSPTLTLTNRSLFEVLQNEFVYDAESQKFQVERRTSSFGTGLYILISILGTLLTCTLECFVAGVFGLRSVPKGLIFGTNALSQALMYVLYVVLYGVIFWKYKYVVILLEIMVYLGEYHWYCRKMHGVSRKRILFYTVTANTASLILGLFTTYSLILSF